MTRWPLFAVVCVAGPALAQPVTRPQIEPCRVTIAYAPEEVRAEIEAWVRAEPRCERELEVRVVPSDDGLYLQARDGTGRVRERVVPDAQSAAVLVVSWMADDSLGPTYIAPAAGPSASISDPEMPADLGGAVVAVPAVQRARSQRWLTLGALGGDSGGGFRGQIDLFAGARWSIGVGAGWRGDRESHDGVGQARVLFSTGRTFGRFSLRLQLGVGADVSKGDDQMDHRDREMDGPRGDVVPHVEAGFLAKLHLTGSWGLVGGPLLDKSPRSDEPTVSMFLGVQRGL